MKNEPNIGELCKENAMRDAIHIAVAPVVAAEAIMPGEHIGLNADGKAISPDDCPEVVLIGIADPFKIGWIEKGEKFWLFLYPNTITSLRHVWTHPVFKPKVPNLKGNEYAE